MKKSYKEYNNNSFFFCGGCFLFWEKKNWKGGRCNGINVDCRCGWIFWFFIMWVNDEWRYICWCYFGGNRRWNEINVFRRKIYVVWEKWIFLLVWIYWRLKIWYNLYLVWWFFVFRLIWFFLYINIWIRLKRMGEVWKEGGRKNGDFVENVWVLERRNWGRWLLYRWCGWWVVEIFVWIKLW